MIQLSGARDGCSHGSDVIYRRGRLRYGLRIVFSSALLLNRSNLCRPGRLFEEVLDLFKRAFLLAAYKDILNI